MAPNGGGDDNGDGGPASAAAAYAERLTNGAVEQQVSVELDHARKLVIFAVRERFAIAPTLVGVPYAMIDFVQWQRLTNDLQAAGVLNLQPAVRPH